LPPAGRSLADEVIRKLPKGYDQIIGKRFSHRHRSFRRRVAKGRHRSRLHARRAASDPRRANGSARCAFRFEVFKRFKELSQGKTAVLNIAPLFQRPHGRPHRGADGWRCRGHGQPTPNCWSREGVTRNCSNYRPLVTDSNDVADGCRERLPVEQPTKFRLVQSQEPPRRREQFDYTPSFRACSRLSVVSNLSGSTGSAIRCALNAILNEHGRVIFCIELL